MATKATLIGSGWNFSSLWNQALQTLPERPLQKRDYIYASELNLSFVDRYLKMHAVKMSNPPNARSLRKFSAGHVFEWIVGFILTMTGVLKQKQLKGEVHLPGLLRVSGRLDFIAGGVVDWEKAKAEVVNFKNVFSASVGDMPPIIFHAIEQIITSMEKEFKNNPLKEVVLECKSVSSFMSEKIEKTKEPMPHHVLQCAHYLLANNMDEASLVYVCKDDLISHQFQIPNNKKLLSFYRDDVREMTDYYNLSNHSNPLKTLPPKEPQVLFEVGTWRFTKNFKVEYSSYLEMLYGFASPEDFRLKFQSTIASWNRVFKRCVRGDNMTTKNFDVIREAQKSFKDWDKYVQLAKKDNAFAKPEDNEDE